MESSSGRHAGRPHAIDVRAFRRIWTGDSTGALVYGAPSLPACQSVSRALLATRRKTSDTGASGSVPWAPPMSLPGRGIAVVSSLGWTGAQRRLKARLSEAPLPSPGSGAFFVRVFRRLVNALLTISGVSRRVDKSTEQTR